MFSHPGTGALCAGVASLAEAEGSRSADAAPRWKGAASPGTQRGAASCTAIRSRPSIRWLGIPSYQRPRLAHARCDPQAVSVRRRPRARHRRACELDSSYGTRRFQSGPTALSRADGCAADRPQYTTGRSPSTTGDVLVVGLDTVLDGALWHRPRWSSADNCVVRRLGPSLLEPRLGRPLQLLPDERVLVAGGRGPGGEPRCPDRGVLGRGTRAASVSRTHVNRAAVERLGPTYGQPVTYYARVSSANRTPDGDRAIRRWRHAGAGNGHPGQDRRRAGHGDTTRRRAHARSPRCMAEPNDSRPANRPRRRNP